MRGSHETGKLTLERGNLRSLRNPSGENNFTCSSCLFFS